MKTKLAAFALIISATLCCSNTYGHDLLHRMLGRGGCGCEPASTCCDTPAPSCGRTISISLTLPGRGLLAGLRHCGGGCGATANDCGCDVPVADCGCSAPISSCGCETAPAADCGCDSGCGGGGGGLLSGRLQGLRCGGCGLFKGGIGNGCGCDLMASTPCASACEEVVESCGCDTGCDTGCDSSCGCGLLKGRLFSGRLMNRLGNIGCGRCKAHDDCGCDAPVADCGCSAPVAAPAPSCGCEAAPACGCDAAPSCGCDIAPACGCGLLKGRLGKGGLLSRLGNVGCGRCGSSSGCDCDCEAPIADCGCSAPAPSCGCEAAPACGCGIKGRSGGLLSRIGNIGCGRCGSTSGCGCDCEAPVADCGCSAPAPSCGCEAAPSCGCDSAPACGCGLRGRVGGGGLFSRIGNGGCSQCGSTTGCGCGVRRTPVRNVSARLPFGRKNICDCNDCDPVVAAPGCGCDSNSPYVQSYGASPSTAPMYDNNQPSNSVLTDPAASPITSPSEQSTTPATPAPESNPAAGDGARNFRTPVVDPSSFKIRGVGYRN